MNTPLNLWFSLSFTDLICLWIKLLSSASLRLLCAVLGTSLISLSYALCIECTSDDVVTNTGEVLNSSASDKNNGVFLQVMTDTWNVS